MRDQVQRWLSACVVAGHDTPDGDNAHVSFEVDAPTLEALCRRWLAVEDAQWRPIETAPRDGTRVLLAIEWSDVPVVGKYSHGLWWADTEHHEVSCGAYCYGGSVSSDTNMKPTHWRPLPKSPAIDAAIAEGDQE